ncbi:MAG: VCBS repeat-containing protein [Verrucomicrobia bacterium]|nr:VCBS repeat-containing protein [Verrucomicrobiota bacterium]
MKKNNLFRILPLLTVFSIISPRLHAVINPAMQPRHLHDLYSHVFKATIEEVDAREMRVVFRIDEFSKGELPYERVTMTTGDRGHLTEILSLQKDQSIVVFAGRGGRRMQNRVLYYVGGGSWHKAQMGTDASPEQWELQGNADEGVDPGSEDIMFAVFNGQTAMLWQMARDLATDRAYYPATPFTRFSDRKIDQLEAPVGGVAIFDVNGNGRLDLIATSGAGSRVYLQTEEGEFEEKSEALGVGEVGFRSVSLADVQGNGRADLLLDGVIFLQNDQGVFEKSDLLDVDPAGVRSAAFADLNANGFPDVVVSLKEGGLRLYFNSFADDVEGETFLERAEALGVVNLEGAGGYFELGDWSGDGRTDILWLSGPGYLLLNGAEGFDSQTLGGEFDEFEFATASMAPVVDPGRNAVYVLVDDTKWLLENQDGRLVDITRYGNEIQDDVPGLYAALVEDLSMDGTLDIYSLSGTSGSPDFFLNNRGYASFMMPEKYESGLWPRHIYNNLVKTGAAAGDVNGDGANDLLVGGRDGSLWLLTNETPAHRPDVPEAGTVLDERKRISSRSLTVALDAPLGVTGAWVRLFDASDTLVAARQIAGNVNVGSSGPQQVIFTVREPGPHRVDVTFSHGEQTSRPVDLAPEGPRHQTLRIQAR